MTEPRTHESSDDRVAVTVRLPTALHKKVQDEARLRNVSMSALMLEAVTKAAEELEGLVPKLYLYDCDRGQGAVYARSLEEARRTALLDSGRCDLPRNVHLATAKETSFRKAMGGSTS